MGISGNTGLSGNSNQNEKIYRITILALIGVIVLLSVFLVLSRRTLKEVRVDQAFTEEINRDLQAELDSVLAEYNIVKLEYDSILEDKDSIIQANAKEIQQLIARSADYNRIRRQLNGLREITQNYVREIDSLVTVNQVLRAENVQIKEEIRQVTARSTALAQDKERLETKVELAAALRAAGISASAVRLRGRDREEETDRASRAEQIKICFTIAENPIAPMGPHTFYVRIAGPDNAILRISDSDEYAFVSGNDVLQFSVKGTVDFQGESVSKCLYWQRLGDFAPGSYLVSLFSDEMKLAETSLLLR